MKTAENIKKVALLFFIFLGLIHIVSGLMFSSNYLMPLSLTVNRILDIPFAMSGLVYGLSCLYTGLGEKPHKIANIAFIAFSLLIFIALLYINLFIPDKPPGASEASAITGQASAPTINTTS